MQKKTKNSKNERTNKQMDKDKQKYRKDFLTFYSDHNK